MSGEFGGGGELGDKGGELGGDKVDDEGGVLSITDIHICIQQLLIGDADTIKLGAEISTGPESQVQEGRAKVCSKED